MHSGKTDGEGKLKRTKIDRLLETVLKNSPVAMFVIDKSHRIIQWNTAMERLSGVRSEEMIGTNNHWKLFNDEKQLTLADLMVDGKIRSIEDLNRLYKARNAVFQKSDLLEDAYEAVEFFPKFGRNGRWLHFTCAAIRENDDITGAIETFEDVTEQIRAEELYRVVANNSAVGVYVEQEGRIIFANEQFKEYVGFENGDLGCSTDFIHPLDRRKASEERAEMLAGRRKAPYLFRVVRKDGGIRWIMEKVSRIEYRGKEAVLGNYLDITEQRKAELELKSVRDLEMSILEAIPIAVLGLKNRVITFANPSVKNVFGWEPEELIGKDTVILYRSREDYEKIGRDFYPVLEREKVFREEFTCRRKDGKEIICMVGVARVGEYLKERTIVATYEDITDQKIAEADLKRSFERLKRSMEDTIQTIAMIVEARDPYTAGHQRAVDKLAVGIAEEMGIPREKIDGIHTAAVIHDIGKIYIPAEMLSKPGHLSEIEYDIMKTHPQVSYDILKRIDFPWPVATIVYQHHERYNGSGYPRGLKGDEILIEARILAVADVVESMASHRPYRPTVGMDKAIEEIKKNRGILYDPDVVDACLRLFEKGFKLD